MSKFDRMVKQVTADTFTSTKELAAAINNLHEIADALKEGMTHYADREKLNNPLEVWYHNAREHYENKLINVNALILKLEGKLLVNTFNPEVENAQSH